MTGIQITDQGLHIQVRRDSRGLIASGLVLGDILHQNQALILTLHPGELKERPAVGTGIGDMLLDHDPAYWRTRIREQLEMDGQQVRGVRITPTSIEIDASY